MSAMWGRHMFVSYTHDVCPWGPPPPSYGVPGPCVVQFSMSAAETFPNDPPVCCNCNCNCKDRHSAPHSTHTQVPCCHSPVYIHTYTDSIAWCSYGANSLPRSGWSLWAFLLHLEAARGARRHPVHCMVLRMVRVPTHSTIVRCGWYSYPATPNNPKCRENTAPARDGGLKTRRATLGVFTSSVEYSPVCAPCRTLGIGTWNAPSLSFASY